MPVLVKHTLTDDLAGISGESLVINNVTVISPDKPSLYVMCAPPSAEYRVMQQTDNRDFVHGWPEQRKTISQALNQKVGWEKPT
jgi:hypothetical protein